jgi:hypothetical protein
MSTGHRTSYDAYSDERSSSARSTIAPPRPEWIRPILTTVGIAFAAMFLWSWSHGGAVVIGVVTVAAFLLTVSHDTTASTLARGMARGLLCALVIFLLCAAAFVALVAMALSNAHWG